MGNDSSDSDLGLGLLIGLGAAVLVVILIGVYACTDCSMPSCFGSARVVVTKVEPHNDIEAVEMSTIGVGVLQQPTGKPVREKRLKSSGPVRSNREKSYVYEQDRGKKAKGAKPGGKGSGNLKR